MSPYSVNRRDFLLQTSMATGALSLGGGLFSKVARAAGELDRYFLVIYFEGGWDTLLSLDPRDPRTLTDQTMLQTGIQPAYDRLPGQFSRAPIDAGPFTLGPVMGELAELADLFSVVRGINMATLTHEVGRRYFITGRPPSGLTARGNSIATYATAQIGRDTPVPHLGHAIENYNIDQPPFAGAMPVAAVDQMRYILQEDLGIPTNIPANVKGALGNYWKHQRDCAPEHGASVSRLAAIYRDNRARAREVVNSQLHREFEFNSPQMAEVRARYGFGEGQTESPQGRAALAAQAFKTGLSRVVSLSLAQQLDTHDGGWANDQSTRQLAGWTALARLLRDLRDTESPGGGSFLSKTTMVVFSEFSRTPRLNERNGRDHHLTNCALLAGAGIKGGVAFGSSSDLGMGPERVNLDTGEVSDSGENIAPQHVLTTALTAAGLDATKLRSRPLTGLLEG